MVDLNIKRFCIYMDKKLIWKQTKQTHVSISDPLKFYLFICLVSLIFAADPVSISVLFLTFSFSLFRWTEEGQLSKPPA